eukprot:TRINITY_DN6905_c0_g1_i1.p3 TRINITY_DN6905_c0_g1~~TRINITY_DN6905_c0_g1_i1.p3  ORF type:complete len:177 (+),score=11.58 TRINITY_DN6905_c0_g1_i1:352-882(+)
MLAAGGQGVAGRLPIVRVLPSRRRQPLGCQPHDGIPCAPPPPTHPSTAAPPSRSHGCRPHRRRPVAHDAHDAATARAPTPLMGHCDTAAATTTRPTTPAATPATAPPPSAYHSGGGGGGGGGSKEASCAAPATSASSATHMRAPRAGGRGSAERSGRFAGGRAVRRRDVAERHTRE